METAKLEAIAPADKVLNLRGYEVVRAQFFSTRMNPVLTISCGKLWFNTACLKKLDDVEYVELLLNAVSNCIAIRPCEKDNPNAIHRERLKADRWGVSTVGCRGLAQTLLDKGNWDEEAKDRFRGQIVCNGDDMLMLFELDEPEIIKTVETELPPVTTEEGEETTQGRETLVLKETVMIY